MRYLVNTDSDRREMLAEIGVESIDDLFSDIPEEVKARFRPLGLSPKSELEVRGTVERFASNNADPNEVISFLGGGMYDHYIPSVVAHVLSRSEFYTAYTPYQPEISQGTLTAMFEFQTLVCELFGMEVANASMYDGGSALAEAVLMAERVAGKGRIGISRALFPHYRRVVETYAWAADLELIEVPYLTPEGRIDRSAIPSGLSGLVVQSPNAFGVIEDLTGLKNKVRDGLLIVATNPIAMGIIAPPGE
ncbi:MAG TPA: glycine dehydrogenase, partial [Candidatus Acetothermia bacterium]|nr:glycine dehydrogenase [Candidatus Acetothermia bacterium]